MTLCNTDYTKFFLGCRSKREKDKFHKRSINTCANCGHHNTEINGRFKSWECESCKEIINTIENKLTNSKKLDFIHYMNDLYESCFLGRNIPDVPLFKKDDPWERVKTIYHPPEKTPTAVVINIPFAASITRRYGKNQLLQYHQVKRILADHGARMPIKKLEQEIMKMTGKSLRSTKKIIRRLKNRTFVYQEKDQIVLIAQHKLSKLHGRSMMSEVKMSKIYNIHGRRSVWVMDIFDEIESFTIFVRAAHRYLEDGYFVNYHKIVKYSRSQGTLTLAGQLSIPTERGKVGCATYIISDYLGIAYGTIFYTLKGHVDLQYNVFHYSHKRFDNLFPSNFFFLHKRFSYKRNRSGVVVTNVISSKSTFDGLFNVSVDRLSCSDDSIECLHNKLMLNRFKEVDSLNKVLSIKELELVKLN